MCNIADELAWEVLLPGKRPSTWGVKPRGTVIINEGQEGEERISLPKTVATILAAKQKSGEVRPKSRAELLYMIGELSHTCARARIERLVDRREYTSSEMTRKLREDGYTQKTIDECVNRACSAGLISNNRFAESFIRSKISAGWGMGRIARELSQRGIDVNDIDGWPYEFLDPEDELTRAADVARRRRIGGDRAYEKLVRYLCGRGFALSVATRAARQVLDEFAQGDLVDF